MMRHLRAALSIGLLWALAWLPVGAGVALYAGSGPPQPGDLLFRPVAVGPFLSAWTVWGGLSGVGFAVVLGIAERRRGLAQLSLGRLAAWGAVGAMSVPAALVTLDLVRGALRSPLYDWRPPVVSLLVSAGLGAVCAAGTLLLARRAPPDRG
jgi:hypothetical protein